MRSMARHSAFPSESEHPKSLFQLHPPISLKIDATQPSHGARTALPVRLSAMEPVHPLPALGKTRLIQSFPARYVGSVQIRETAVPPPGSVADGELAALG